MLFKIVHFPNTQLEGLPTVMSWGLSAYKNWSRDRKIAQFEKRQQAYLDTLRDNTRQQNRTIRAEIQAQKDIAQLHYEAALTPEERAALAQQKAKTKEVQQLSLVAGLGILGVEGSPMLSFSNK